MFSAFRKLTGRAAEGSANTTSPPGMQTMAASLQRRFARGVQYNSKCGFLCFATMPPLHTMEPEDCAVLNYEG